MAGVNGLGLAAAAAGGLFLYAGVKNISVLKAVQNLIRGQAPATGQQAGSVASGAAAGTGAGTGAGVSAGSAQAALQAAAAAHGWGSGAEWQALQNVEMAEAGFNLTAKNPNSDAYGMAQFINGPSEYYTYGGDPNTASGQATAMCNYIAQRYGDPLAAWNHEQTYGWY